MKKLLARIRKFLESQAIKRLNLAYPENYHVLLTKDENIFMDVDLKTIYKVQNNRVYHFQFIRGHNKFKLTITQLKDGRDK